MPLSPGHKLAAYEIIAPLGAGGMGEVYLARDQRLNRRVALKLLPEPLSSDKVARARPVQSARTNHRALSARKDVATMDEHRKTIP